MKPDFRTAYVLIATLILMLVAVGVHRVFELTS